MLGLHVVEDPAHRGIGVERHARPGGQRHPHLHPPRRRAALAGRDVHPVARVVLREAGEGHATGLQPRAVRESAEQRRGDALDLRPAVDEGVGDVAVFAEQDPVRVVVVVLEEHDRLPDT